MSTVHSKNTKFYRRRLLLCEVRGPFCFDDLKTVNGIHQLIFQLACVKVDLLEGNKHWHSALEEAVDVPFKCAVKVQTCCLWVKYIGSLSEDYKR